MCELRGIDLKRGSFCRSCEAEVSPEADVCVKCEEKLRNTTQASESKVVAGLFGIFLGVFEVQRFYLEYTSIGLIQLLVSLLNGIFTRLLDHYRKCKEAELVRKKNDYCEAVLLW